MVAGIQEIDGAIKVVGTTVNNFGVLSPSNVKGANLIEVLLDNNIEMVKNGVLK